MQNRCSEGSAGPPEVAGSERTQLEPPQQLGRERGFLGLNPQEGLQFHLMLPTALAAPGPCTSSEMTGSQEGYKIKTHKTLLNCSLKTNKQIIFRET